MAEQIPNRPQRLASLITDDIPLHTRKIVRDHGCGMPGGAAKPSSLTGGPRWVVEAGPLGVAVDGVGGALVDAFQVPRRAARSGQPAGPPSFRIVSPCP